MQKSPETYLINSANTKTNSVFCSVEANCLDESQFIEILVITSNISNQYFRSSSVKM